MFISIRFKNEIFLVRICKHTANNSQFPWNIPVIYFHLLFVFASSIEVIHSVSFQVNIHFPDHQSWLINKTLISRTITYISRVFVVVRTLYWIYFIWCCWKLNKIKSRIYYKPKYLFPQKPLVRPQKANCSLSWSSGVFI